MITCRTQEEPAGEDGWHEEEEEEYSTRRVRAETVGLSVRSFSFNRSSASLSPLSIEQGP